MTKMEKLMAAHNALIAAQAAYEEALAEAMANQVAFKIGVSIEFYVACEKVSVTDYKVVDSYDEAKEMMENFKKFTANAFEESKAEVCFNDESNYSVRYLTPKYQMYNGSVCIFVSDDLDECFVNFK